MSRYSIETLLSKSTEELIEMWRAYEDRIEDDEELYRLSVDEIDEMETIEEIIANRCGGPINMYDLAADQAWRRH